MTHLDAILERLAHEQARLEAAKTPQEREMRTVWVNGIRRELAKEKDFLAARGEPEMSDDELLAELVR
jgi:hypothetical protein